MDNIDDLMSQKGSIINSFDELCRFGFNVADLSLVSIIQEECQTNIKPYAKGMKTIITNIKEGIKVVPYDYVQLIADPESIKLLPKRNMLLIVFNILILNVSLTILYSYSKQNEFTLISTSYRGKSRLSKALYHALVRKRLA